MRLIIYGDFNCPDSYLASQRAAQTIPAVIGPDRVPRQGVDGLRYLADLAGHAGAADGPATKPAAEAGQGRQRRPAARVS